MGDNKFNFYLNIRQRKDTMVGPALSEIPIVINFLS